MGQITLRGKYQTRDGEKVRILCTDGPDPFFPIVGFIGSRLNTDKWTQEGRWDIPHGMTYPENMQDIIPVVVEHEGWVITNGCDVFPGIYSCKEMAETDAQDVEVTCGRPLHVAHITWKAPDETPHTNTN